MFSPRQYEAIVRIRAEARPAMGSFLPADGGVAFRCEESIQDSPETATNEYWESRRRLATLKNIHERVREYISRDGFDAGPGGVEIIDPAELSTQPTSRPRIPAAIALLASLLSMGLALACNKLAVFPASIR